MKASLEAKSTGKRAVGGRKDSGDPFLSPKTGQNLRLFFDGYYHF